MVDGLIGGGYRLDNAVGGGHALADVGVTLIDLGLRIAGGAGGVMCVGGDLLNRLAELFSRSCDTFDTGLLLF